MTDAELIGMAALVQASCTEISAANQGRAINEQPPDYYGYSDLHGDQPSLRIAQEIDRRKQIRELIKLDETGDGCYEVHAPTATMCMEKSGHKSKHRSIAKPSLETELVEWDNTPF